jgi:hypothetical protein
LIAILTRCDANDPPERLAERSTRFVSNGFGDLDQLLVFLLWQLRRLLPSVFRILVTGARPIK